MDLPEPAYEDGYNYEERPIIPTIKITPPIVEPVLIGNHRQFMKMLSNYRANSYVYILYLGEQRYKYGVTNSLGSRLRSHYTNLRYLGVVDLIACDTRKEADTLELRFKHYTNKRGVVDGQSQGTEIIKVSDISPYLEGMRKQLELIRNPPVRTYVSRPIPPIVPCDKIDDYYRSNLPTNTVLIEDQHNDLKRRLRNEESSCSSSATQSLDFAALRLDYASGGGRAALVRSL